jgi:soluble lytic murein transglycosylase-like protein
VAFRLGVAICCLVGGSRAVSAASPSRQALERTVEAAASKHRVPAAVLKGLVRQESNWDPQVRSKSGAAGLAQLMPATARELGLHVKGRTDERLDPAKAAGAGARYLKEQFDRFPEARDDLERWRFALAAYNAGRGRVNRCIRQAGLAGRKGITWKQVEKLVPRETADYVRKIIGASGGAAGFALEYERARRGD